ncbi:hypothetical protein [Pseudonocardia endophytica]|uniref:Uncharacterized protein n=1 Tax=Pseudonocardia endophytica TaxID=401976 RepID=A0A4R1HSK7_PSEEN|nr:hypothetical protein [Pseudonocardia endophytica]TCK25158.1 hypothetical protein EV378_0956 [Pseudonocardia endophytica]
MSGTRAENTGLRVLGAIGLAIATVIHVMVGGVGGVMPILFWLSGLGTLVGLVLLFVRPRLGWIVGGGVSALTAIGYVLRSTVGLPPLVPNAVGFWMPVSGGICTIAEIVVAVLAVYALADRASVRAAGARA